MDNSSHFQNLLKLISPFLLASLLVACNDTMSDAKQEPVSNAQASVQEGLVGAVFGELTPDKTGFDSAGTISKDSRIKIKAEHYFALGSNGKSITAILAAKMVEAGLVHWHSRILDVLPELEGEIRDEYTTVTLEQLLNHKSGMIPLTDGDEAQSFEGDLPENARERRLVTIKWMLNQAPVASAGTGFHYSNAGYTVAGAMMEKLGNSTYLNLVNEWVLKPLDISAIMTMPATRLDNQPLGYLGQKNHLTRVDPHDEILLLLDDVISPAGSLCMTAQDYGKYLQWHLRALSGADTPLPSSYLDKLHALNNNEYALGWLMIKNSQNNNVVLFHGGETDGFTTTAVLDGAGKSGVFAVTNTASDDENNPWVGDLLEKKTLDLLVKNQQNP
ncbi:MAG: hypothetical protein RL497_1264 [Pseudomonadota bacterium]